MEADRQRGRRFFADGRLKEITIADGRTASADLGADASAGSGASWLLDGSLLFAPDARGVIRRLLNGAVSDATNAPARAIVRTRFR